MRRTKICWRRSAGVRGNKLNQNDRNRALFLFFVQAQKLVRKAAKSKANGGDMEEDDPDKKDEGSDDQAAPRGRGRGRGKGRGKGKSKGKRKAKGDKDKDEEKDMEKEDEADEGVEESIPPTQPDRITDAATPPKKKRKTPLPDGLEKVAARVRMSPRKRQAAPEVAPEKKPRTTNEKEGRRPWRIKAGLYELSSIRYMLLKKMQKYPSTSSNSFLAWIFALWSQLNSIDSVWIFVSQEINAAKFKEAMVESGLILTLVLPDNWETRKPKP